MQGNTLALIPYTGTFLLVGLPALWLWGIYYVVGGIRRQTLERSVAILIGFLLFNITYVSGIANFLSSFENNRYRFPCDALFVVLLGIAIDRSRGLSGLNGLRWPALLHKR
jgi:Ca2+/Na+ antiporter